MDLNLPLSSSSSDSSSGSSELDDAITSVVTLAVNAMLDCVDDEEDDVREPSFKRRVTIVRRRQECEARLMSHYFVDEPLYNAKIFRKRYRMSKRLFLTICDDLEARYDIVFYVF